MANPEKKQKQNYSILCDLVQRYLELALEDAKTLPGLERSKKEARLKICFINGALDNTRQCLDSLEPLIWKNEQTN